MSHTSESLSFTLPCSAVLRKDVVDSYLEARLGDFSGVRAPFRFMTISLVFCLWRFPFLGRLTERWFVRKVARRLETDSQVCQGLSGIFGDAVFRRRLPEPETWDAVPPQIQSEIAALVSERFAYVVVDSILGTPRTSDFDKSRHPRLAEGLVWLLAPRERRDNILGDLSEEFALNRLELGPLRAKLKYWDQALTSTEEFLWQRFKTLVKWIGGLSQLAYLTKRLVDIVKRFFDL